MRSYSKKDIVRSIRNVGIKKGDIVFVNPEIYKFGIYKDAHTSEDYFKDFYKILKEIITDKGTLCINTYTFGTLRNNESFNYNSHKTTSGKLGEIILKDKKSIRSNHPVFSVASIGKNSKNISKNNSKHNYGYNSPYWKILKYNGKILSLGMKPWLNPFNHTAEYLTGIPYFFNKHTNVKYFKNRKKINITYSSFVRYLDFNLVPNYRTLEKELKKNKLIKKKKLGDGYIYSMNSKKYFNLVLKILSKNQYEFIDKKFFLNSIKNKKIKN